MPSVALAVSDISRFFGGLRWAFMPLGLLALVAVGVHAAADVLDDQVLRAVDALDVWLDQLLAQHDATAAWVNRVDSPQRTVIARAVALTWEVLVDLVLAWPMLGYDEVDAGAAPAFSLVRRDTWRDVVSRLNRQPTLMRLSRPLLTAIFAFGGAYAVARLVEATLFGGVLVVVRGQADLAATLARACGGAAMLLLLSSHWWRAVWRALEHADAVCVASPRPWLVGLRGSVVAVPLALALTLQAEALLSFFR